MSEHKPRLCHIIRGAGGYGFHLHGDKDRLGQFIRKVEANSPADESGLKEGDKIIEVNGKNVENEDHHEVVGRIKEKSGETTLLVVDAEADKYFSDNHIPITEELLTSVDDSNEPTSPPPAYEVPKQEENEKPTSSIPDQRRPRLCHMVRNDNGFGFNLHSEKGKQGSFIKSVEPNSASEIAGLKEGDRIIEVNGENMEYAKHNVLVAAIKGSGQEVDLLVVDEETDKYFKDLQVVPNASHVSGELSLVQENTDKETNSSKDMAASADLSTTSANDGTSLPDMDLAMLKERSRVSSRKKGAPQSNWNNRQAIFNNL